MGHELSGMRHGTEIRQNQNKGNGAHLEDFVLEKSIFNNIFEKDIRRVFIYKKAERLAKAIHLIAPAFAESASLRNRIDAIAIGLVDAAILPSGAARSALSRELLALSSVLSIARSGGLLSFMNVELISHEAHALLQEVAAYEEPRLFLDEAPTLSGIAKKALAQGSVQSVSQPSQKREVSRPATAHKGHIKDNKDAPDSHIKDRREAVLSVIRNKGKASIKDISTLIRGVSEKTIQRELLALIASGVVLKQGERRWSTYSLA
jgi:DNA-binding transcriptional ArsR family regulator